MILRVYLALVIVAAILTAVFSRWESGEWIVALWTSPKEARRVAARQGDIARQRAVVAETLLNGVPLHWESSLVPQAVAASARIQCDGRDDSDTARCQLMFQAETGRLESISFLCTEGSDEGRLSPEDAERVAGAWLNRLRGLYRGPWRPLGREDHALPTTRNTIFSRWAAPGCVAFIGIERRTGMPRLIKFRYPPPVPAPSFANPFVNIMGAVHTVPDIERASLPDNRPAA